MKSAILRPVLPAVPENRLSVKDVAVGVGFMENAMAI
jgi:hypothetical protein